LISTEFIIYVSNQDASTLFYKSLLDLDPSLYVPGMTEFTLGNQCKLGIMPENGISKILCPNTIHPSKGNGIPRCELYLKINQASKYYNRGIALGAKEISPMSLRDWGDIVGYLADADGHIIAFAENSIK